MELNMKAVIGYGWMLPADIANKISNDFRFSHKDYIKNLSEYDENSKIFAGKIFSEISPYDEPQVLNEERISAYFEDKVISELYDLFEDLQYEGSPRLYFFTVID